MFLGFLLLDPFVLLAVGRYLERETADVESEAEEVGQPDCGGERGEEGDGEGVEGNDGHELCSA